MLPIVAFVTFTRRVILILISILQFRNSINLLDMLHAQFIYVNTLELSKSVSQGTLCIQICHRDVVFMHVSVDVGQFFAYIMHVVLIVLLSDLLFVVVDLILFEICGLL